MTTDNREFRKPALYWVALVLMLCAFLAASIAGGSL
jgi:hypothetical protein